MASELSPDCQRGTEAAALSLPPCPYRSDHSGGLTCRAAEGSPVTAQDCLTCPIPEGVSHDKACLYLIPIRDEGESRFVCHCYSNRMALLAAKDWRRLCFCNYWFPRGPADRELATRFDEARTRYRPLVSGKTQTHTSDRPMPAPVEKPNSNRFIRWLQWQRNWWFRE